MRRARASLWLIGATVCTVAVMCVLPITPKRPVRTAVVERGTLARTLAVEATVGYPGLRPVSALSAGRVERVCVSQGQRVRAGELLAALDTSAESAALSALYQAERARGEAVAALSGASAALVDAGVERLKLLSAVEAKRLRADADAIVERVYVSGGDTVVPATPLLLLRQEGTELTAALRLKDSARLQPGDRAVVMKNGAAQALATLTAFGTPTSESQPVRFSCEESLWSAGDTVELEIAWEVRGDTPLAPLSAVGQDDALWVVEEGRAYRVPVDTDERDPRSLAVPEALAGKRVVLYPDEAGLTEGCLVKERKR